jgi:hypothetical protein
MLEPRGRLSLQNCSTNRTVRYVSALIFYELVRKEERSVSSLSCMSLENGESETCAAQMQDCAGG